MNNELTRNKYPWQREIEYSIATWGKSLSWAGEYVTKDGAVIHDAQNELIQEMSLAILEAGKCSGNRVSGDPYRRDCDLSPHVVEICKRKLRRLKKQKFRVIDHPDVPERKPEGEIAGQHNDDITAQEQDDDNDDIYVREQACDNADGDAKYVVILPLANANEVEDRTGIMEIIVRQADASADAEKVKGFMEHLSEQEERVILLHYAHGRSFRKIADEMGIDEKQVRRIHEGAIEYLRECLGVKPPSKGKVA